MTTSCRYTEVEGAESWSMGEDPRPLNTRARVTAGAGDTAGNSTDTESLVQQPGYNKLKMR